ncbi:MAG: hypothetical protein AB9834_19985 [Lentimicrobium sp.]
MKTTKLEMKINLTGFLLVPELVWVYIQAGLSAWLPGQSACLTASSRQGRLFVEGQPVKF